MKKINVTENPAESKLLMPERMAAMASGMKLTQKKADRNFTMMGQIIESQNQLLSLAP